MKMKFCKVCGTIYDPAVGPCPRCTERELMEQQAESQADDDLEPGPAPGFRLGFRGHVLVIGVPAMIGLFYLVFSLAKNLMK